MTEIAEDVMKAAEAAWLSAATSSLADDMVSAIARAIQAERERAAKVLKTAKDEIAAKGMALDTMGYPGVAHFGKYAADRVAVAEAAIRSSAQGDEK